MIRSCLLALLAGLGIGSPAVCVGEAPAKKRPLPDVLVVADAAVKDDTLRPAPGKPIYYLVIGGAERNIGEDVTEVGRPVAAAVRRELVKALASQGFVEAQPGGPKPEIAVLFSWGTARFLGNDEIMAAITKLVPEYNDPNKQEIMRLLGKDKADRHLMSQLDADQLNEAIRNDRVYVEVAAMDLAAAGRKQRQLLWRTRMSLDWRDHGPESLGVMLASAAPFFGRATEKGVFIDDHLRRKAEVTIGDARVVDEPAPKPAEPARK